MIHHIVIHSVKNSAKFIRYDFLLQETDLLGFFLGQTDEDITKYEEDWHDQKYKRTKYLWKRRFGYSERKDGRPERRRPVKQCYENPINRAWTFSLSEAGKTKLHLSLMYLLSERDLGRGESTAFFPPSTEVSLE